MKTHPPIWIFVAFVAAVLAIIIGVGTGKSLSEPEQQTQHRTQPNNADGNAAPQSASEGRHDQRNSWSRVKESIAQNWYQIVAWAERNEHAVVALSTIVIAAFTLALFVATFLLWFAGERHSERELRAYVSVSDVKAENFENDAQFLLEFKNSGQTPAYQVTVETRVKLADYPLTESLVIKSEPKGVTILGPGTTGHGFVPAGRRLTADELAAIREGTKGVYVYGEINYVDAFDKKRCTKFRFMIGGKVDVRPEGFMGACEEGNEAT